MQIVVDGILTHYEVIGEKNKKPLVILHGWKRSLTEWVPIAKQLIDRYQVILLDLPGFGQTMQPSTTFSIYDYTDFVEHFLLKLEIKKTTFVGHSFGGRIGIILAAQTKRIEKLILVDGAGVEKRTATAKVKIALFKLLKHVFPGWLVEKLRSKLGSPDYKSAGQMKNIFIKVINEDLSYLLPNISVRTLLIWGEKDTEVPLWKVKKMQKEIPYSHFRVVWGAGHSPYLEKPREFIEILKEGLSS